MAKRLRIADAEAVARKYGIPVPILLATIHQESRGRVDAQSGAGAQGLMQLMPATARGLGVTDPFDPEQNLDAGARYLAMQYKRFGKWPLALAAYNAGPGRVVDGSWHDISETSNYVSDIMRKAARLGRSAARTGDLGFTPTVERSGPGDLTLPARRATIPVPGSGVDLTGLALGNLSKIAQGTYDPSEALSELSRATQEATPSTITLTRRARTLPLLPSDRLNAQQLPLQQGQVGKWAKLSSSADRPGVHTSPAVLEFVAGIGHGIGQPLTIGTGTNHSRMTVNGNVSNHWDGNAADIPATGVELHKLGYVALRQAGMSRAEAERAAKSGGLFNVGKYQIIFATNEGGNHFNHLHVGIRS